MSPNTQKSAAVSKQGGLEIYVCFRGDHQGEAAAMCHIHMEMEEGKEMEWNIK